MNASTDDGHGLTIDELARRSGMTVRNIRAHQSRGLLQAPVVQGRTGFYGPEHVQRLEVIKNLQADGFNLAAIQRLLEQAHATGDELGELRTTVLTPFEDEPTEIVDLQELADEYNIADDFDELVKRAEKLGFVVPISDGRYEVISPTILRAGIDVIQLGLSVKEAFDLLMLIQKNVRSVAHAFAEMVDDTVVRPFEDRGFQPDEWEPVRDAIIRLRPLASEVVLAAFKVEMSEAAEEQLGKALSRAASKPVASGGGSDDEKTRTKAARAARDRSSKAAKGVVRSAGKGASKAVPKRRSSKKR